MTPHRYRVVLVDDDADFAEGVSLILETAGFAVRSVRSGGLRGSETVLALRARGDTQPVILVSGADNAPMLADVLGLRHWLVKPFDPEELLHALRVTLNEKRA